MIENKKNILTLIIIFVLFFTSDVFAGFGKYIVKFNNGKKSLLRLTNVNNIDYVSLNNLAKAFFQKAKVNLPENELIFNNKKLKFSSFSFYVNYINKTHNRIIQFRRPCITYANNLLIPFNSMLIALEVLQIYSPRIDKDIIYLNRFKLEKLPVANALNSEDNNSSQSGNNFYSNLVVKVKDSINNIEFNTKPKKNIANVNNKNIDNKAKNIDNKAPIIRKSTPNSYVIPQNLKRNLGENSSYDKKKNNPDDLFANNTNNALSNNKTIKIIKVYAEKKENNILIHLYSNGIIEQYQKPEFEANKLIIRIPNVVNEISDYSLVLKLKDIKSITAKKIANFQIYYIIINNIIKKCSSRRNGPNELIFNVVPARNKNANRKSFLGVISAKKKNNVNKKEEINKAKQKKSLEKINKVDFSDEKKKWDLDCIVIDPGHGGKDPGAVGISGIYEKDITLKIAKRIKELLKKRMPNTKVVLTRNDDRFIELYKRGQIANNVHGKLFISIHLNSAKKKPSNANGFETYILRPGKNKDAIRVANFENSAIKFEKKSKRYKSLTNEDLIIATMAQSSFVKFSELFARLVQSEVSKSTHLNNRGVKQAGFYVLIGASMPNVLFEAGFLSNKKDEKFVSSDKGINKIASGIVNAIVKYADEYKKY